MSLNEALHDGSPHIGQRLKAARLSQGRTLSEMSQHINIRSDYLANIESLNIEALPSIGYVLGYVRSYAKALDMDASQAVLDYKADVEIPKNLMLRDAPHFVPKFQMRLPRGFAPAVVILSMTIFLGAWYGLSAQNPAAENYSIAQETLGDNTSNKVVTRADRVTLQATAPSWIEVKNAKGTVLTSQILITGQAWQGPIDKSYTISVRDSGAVDFYYGDIRLGPLGAAGEPKTDMPLDNQVRLENLDVAQMQDFQ